jgi:hypothetical protein
MMERRPTLSTQRFSNEVTEPSKEFKMVLVDIMNEARAVEYEYRRRRAALSCDTSHGHDDAPLRN